MLERYEEIKASDEDKNTLSYRFQKLFKQLNWKTVTTISLSLLCGDGAVLIVNAMKSYMANGCLR